MFIELLGSLWKSQVFAMLASQKLHLVKDTLGDQVGRLIGLSGVNREDWDEALLEIAAVLLGPLNVVFESF
jgi:hypothetical protein